MHYTVYLKHTFCLRRSTRVYLRYMPSPYYQCAGLLPVMPLEPKDFIGDCLHGSLLRIAPRVHQVTHTRYLHSEEEAEAVGNTFQRLAKVSNYTAYFRDKKKPTKIDL